MANNGVTRSVYLSKGTIGRLDKLYELRKWDPNKVNLDEAIARAISIAWLVVENKHK